MGHNGVVSSYTISIGFLGVDGQSTDPQILGQHSSGGKGKGKRSRRNSDAK